MWVGSKGRKRESWRGDHKQTLGTWDAGLSAWGLLVPGVWNRGEDYSDPATNRTEEGCVCDRVLIDA